MEDPRQKRDTRFLPTGSKCPVFSFQFQKTTPLINFGTRDLNGLYLDQPGLSGFTKLSARALRVRASRHAGQVGGLAVLGSAVYSRGLNSFKYFLLWFLNPMVS